jgi:hypothetical protein
MPRIARWRYYFIGFVFVGGLVGIEPVLTARSISMPSMAEYITAICAATFGSSSPAERPFLAESGEAMTRMMGGMGIKSTGDVDRDFVDMMVPHHQAAIDMAIAVLRYGRNAQIKRLAQEIIVTQQQEIAAMRLAVGEPLPASAPSPTALSSEPTVDVVAVR